ncbi:unnamed protein product, partial [Rotaria magnacalcarata]
MPLASRSLARLINSKLRTNTLVGFQLKCFASTQTTDLKEVLRELIPKEQKRVAAFKAEHKDTPIGQVTVDMIYGGMRSIKGLVYDTSVLDANEGIRFRGKTIEECQAELPKAKGGEEPLPEGLFWLLATSQIPTQEQVDWVTREWNNRADIPQHVVTMLNNFPAQLHPMSQFSAAITVLNLNSKFAKAYSDNVPKSKYWEYIYEDSMDLIAKLPTIAAIIYRNLYRDGTAVGAID